MLATVGFVAEQYFQFPGEANEGVSVSVRLGSGVRRSLGEGWG